MVIAAAGYGASGILDTRTRSDADAALADLLRTGASQLETGLARARTAAVVLAGNSRVQIGLRSHRDWLIEIARTHSGVTFLDSGGRRRAGPPTGSSLTASASVVDRGAAVGTVVVAVPLQRATRVARPPYELVVLHDGESAAPLSFPHLEVQAGSARTIDTPRQLRAHRLDLGNNWSLVALVPASAAEVSATTDALVAGTAAAAFLALLLGFGILRTGALPTDAPNDITRLLGEVLAVTHDLDALLAIVLEAAVMATRAASGSILERGELARRGESFDLVVPIPPGTTGIERMLCLVAPPDGFSRREVSQARDLARQTAVALENVAQHDEVHARAQRDDLTGLANRRAFRERLGAELHRADRFDTSLSIVMADIDNFKQINDRWGHPAGDLVLERFAAIAQNEIREIDLAARIGGDEFAILLPQTDAHGAGALAERIRASSEATIVEENGSRQVRFTVSLGVATRSSSVGADELIAAADRSLYRAKQDGRNRAAGIE